MHKYNALMAENDLDVDTLKAGNAQAIELFSTQVATLQ